ncbi:MAG: biopolymer transporter ExbD [Microscillaceae bacterium]|nr:biopolymer transporter ExbD [Microscillaceae bacterium]MDW8460442.1 biopolymer transporter ExbD [Cytophagales bacterium]
MGEVNTDQGGGGKHKKKGAKKMSTKIDMTPMVDLAFLLITFFMLTTTFSKPQTMELNMPDKSKDEKNKSMKVKESRTLTLIMGKNRKTVYYYDGKFEPEETKLKKVDYDKIRSFLLKKKEEKGYNEKGEPQIIVLIKFEDKAKYKNMVDLLDEMHICEIPTYAIVDISEAERLLLPGAGPTTEKDKKQENKS